MKDSAFSAVKRSALNSGQVIIEYVLLLLVAVSIATLLVSQLVQRDPDNPGLLVQKWAEMQKVIAEDDPNTRAK